MKTNQYLKSIVRLSFPLLLAAVTLPVFAQQESVAKRVAQLKATLAASQKALKQYQWIETTVISVNGEDKASKEQRCYYGADGGLEKVEIDQSSAPEPRFGLRKRVARREKEEMTEFMKSAVALVKSYIPPNSKKIQASKDAGNASIELLDPGKRIRLDFKNYEKPGDTLGVELNPANNQLLGVNVSTYVDDPSETVKLNVRMGRLEDGTTYPAAATLDVPAKNLKVEVENSGYRKLN